MKPPEQKKPPAISLRRLAMVASATGTVISVVGVGASVAMKITGVPRLPHYLGLVLLATAPAYLARLVVQGIGKYYKRTESKAQRRLARLYLASGVLLLLWVVGGVVFWFWGSAFWEVFMAIGLWALVTWNACAVADVLPHTSCQRGTEIFRSFGWVIAARSLMRHSGLLREREKRLDVVTPQTDTSAFLNRLSLVLIVVALASVPFAMVEVANAVKHWGRSSRTALATTTIPVVTPRRGGSKSKRRGGTSTHSSSSSLPPPPPTGKEPTYDEQCPGGRARLGSAPDEVGRSLLALWKQQGATAAGCPGRARRVGRSSVWFVVGTCGATIRSLGVYVPGQGSTMQYQEAATYGLSLAERGELENASSRVSVGGGDFVLFETPEGTVALSRSVSALPSITPVTAPLWCERYSSTNVPYLKTPPAATNTWHAVVESVGWSWPMLIASEGGEARYAFYGSGGERELLATALCVVPSRCSAWNKSGEELSMRLFDHVTLDEMLEYAP